MNRIRLKKNYKGKALRLWVQALDAENIEKALKNLKDNKQYYNFMLSALGRSRADWLAGLNLTRAYTVKSGKLFTVGRVQTPTLNLVAQRDIMIENFKPKDYFDVFANTKHINGSFKARLKTEGLKSGLDEENRLKREHVTRMALLNLDENITALIQSDEYARRLAKSLKLTCRNEWFLDYVEHYKKRTPLKDVEDLSGYSIN